MTVIEKRKEIRNSIYRGERTVVFVGYDGREVVYRTGWQLWKQSNHGSRGFVLRYTTSERTVIVFQTPDGSADRVTFVEVDEAELPDGVERVGVGIRDARTE